MKDLSKHIISKDSTLLDAMEKLNNLPLALTLFVEDSSGKLIGTLTDGDIRRSLLSGNEVRSGVMDSMNKTYHFTKTDIKVDYIRKLKAKGIRLLPLTDEAGRIQKIYDLYRLRSVIPVEAVIMAGGRGERLKPITDKTPKSMLKLGKKPILEHTIERLVSYGIELIYISVNYLKDQIIDYFKDGSKWNVSIKYIEEDQPLGTCGALSLIDGNEKDILLTNADLFTNIDYERFYLAFKDQNADMAVASTPYTVNIPYAILNEKNDRITSFKEKPSNTHYANAGIYLIGKGNLGMIPKETYYNSTDLLAKMIDQEMKVIQHPLIGYWIDIGRVEDYNKAKEIVKHI